MKSSKIFLVSCLCLMAVLFAACEKEEPGITSGKMITITPNEADLQSKVQETLITMEDGDTLYFEAGTYEFTNTLSVQDKKNITIMGAGRDASILSFATQTSGAQGIVAQRTDGIVFTAFTIQDAIGDNIKVEDSHGVSFLGMAAIYSGEASEENGAYALYPVKSKHVLVDNCYIRGASDAGIYVGQSEYVVVSNNTVEENVAGIEIENCVNSDVKGNTCINNTGGILVFDLPGLPVILNGYNCRIMDNIVENNNHDNFAPEGNIVGIVPSGTGIMVLSGRKIEIKENTIKDNNLLSVGIFSYLVLAAEHDNPEAWIANFRSEYPFFNPLAHHISVHDNTISSQGWAGVNTTQGPFGQVLIGVYEMAGIKAANIVPDIITDGIFDAETTGSATNEICLMNNGSVSFANLDALNGFQNLSMDASAFECSGVTLEDFTIEARK